MNWKGTKGEVNAIEYCGFIVIQKAPHYEEDDNLLDFDSVGEEQAKANSALFVDAVHTIQQCDKMPSELNAENDRLADLNLKCLVENTKYYNQNEELLRLLKDCMAELYTIHSQYGDKQHARDHSTALTEAESFINKIENGI